jgi:hypothetical protein
MGTRGGQGQKAKGLGLFLFSWGVGEVLLLEGKSGQVAPWPALSAWLPILSLLGEYLAVSFLSSAELPGSLGGWCSEQEKEDHQTPIAWGEGLSPTKPAHLGDGKELQPSNPVRKVGQGASLSGTQFPSCYCVCQ